MAAFEPSDPEARGAAISVPGADFRCYEGHAREILLKELCIETVEAYLNRLATAPARPIFGHSGVSRPHGYLQAACGRRIEGGAERPLFTTLHADAVRLEQGAQLYLRRQTSGDAAWARPEKRKKAIASYARELATAVMCKRWDEYRRRCVNRPDKANLRLLVLAEDWGLQSYSYYRDLSRGQSTMLLHCRTGCIGLNAHLHSIKANPDTIRSGLCPCGTSLHTAEHLFFHCPKLAAAQWEYVHELNHSNLKKMLTHDAAVATSWAIRHFGIDQFKWPKENPDYKRPKQHPHSLYEGT